MKKAYTKPELKELPPELCKKRRSLRVALQIALLIRTQMGSKKQVQVQAFTQVVNAHGGLLESPLMAEVDQEITLVNPGTGKEVRCRVVRVQRSSSDSVTMAFEFHEPTAQFWPITFPPEDWGEFAS